MKILEITSCFYPSKGGVERCVFEVSKRLVERGHEVKVITSSRGYPPRFYRESLKGMEVVRYPEDRFLLEAPILPQIPLQVLAEDFDILHVHNITPLFGDLSTLFGRLRGKPVVLTYHNDVETKLYGRLGDFAGIIYSIITFMVARSASVITCSSRSYFNSSLVLRRLGRQVKIIPMGIDPDAFTPAVPPLPGDYDDINEKRVLFVGQLKDYKGVDILLEAIRILTVEKRLNAHLSIIGSGPLHQTLIKRSERLGLQKLVTFEGTVDDEVLVKSYSASDLVVLPSLSAREAFGMVLLEAMAMGKPIVASDIPGVREIASMGIGRLVTPGDPQALAEAISEVLYNGRYHKKALANREVISRFSWDAIVDRYEEIFRSLVGSEVSIQ